MSRKSSAHLNLRDQSPLDLSRARVRAWIGARPSARQSDDQVLSHALCRIKMRSTQTCVSPASARLDGLPGPSRAR